MIRKSSLWLALLLLPIAGRAAEAVAQGQAFEWGLNITGRAAALTELTNVTLLSAQGDWSLALRSDGTLFAWGSNTGTGAGQTNPPSGNNWIHAYAGWHHGIACNVLGEVDEWGTAFGHDMTEWEATRPTIDDAIQVAAGDAHSMALLSDGRVRTWGTGENAAMNADDDTVTGATMISSGWYHAIALHGDGTITMLGKTGQPGQYLDPTETITNAVFVGTGQFSSYVIKSDGTGVGWGMPDTYGQFTFPAEATNLVSISGGRYHTVAVRGDGVVLAWGDNTWGQTTLPAGLTNANWVSAGRYDSQAIQPSGGDPTPPAGPTTYHVAKTGSDANPGTAASPFLTVQKGMDTAIVAGDVVVVHVGDYAEYVVTKASGTSADPITLLGGIDGEASIRGFRFNNHIWNVVNGMTIWKSQAGNALGNAFTINAASHNSTIQNCVVRDTPYLSRTNFFFDEVTNSIYSPSGSDWAAAGFEVGGRIRIGASSIEPYIFNNQDLNFTIGAITGNVLYVTGDIVAETNLSAWSYVFASGSQSTGIEAVRMVQTGGTGATNVVIDSNIITNSVGIGIDTTGPGPVYIRNNQVDTVAFAGLRLQSDNTVVSGNVFLNNEKFLFYSVREAEDVPHTLSADFNDFVQGYIRAEDPSPDNVVVAFNWFENIHNPLGQGESPGTNWLWASNVFVGFQQHFSGFGKLTDNTVVNNTFYRVGFDTGDSGNLHALLHTFGTNQFNLRNLYLDVGSHWSTNSEGFYASGSTVGSYFGSNWVAGPEPTGWQGKGAFTEIDGVNGGDPVLVNYQNPRGPDGQPFTADDGFRPMPNSPLALLSIGALTAPTLIANTPKVHFTVQPDVHGFYDNVGTNFDTSWESITPFARTNFVRPWNTLDALGDVPCLVHIDASQTISGSYSTNSNWGIKRYLIDWGDGAIDTSWTATNSHVYLWPGTFTVTVQAQNTFGNWASNSLSYRVLPQDQYSGTVYHVATNGSDVAAGTLAAPFATIAKAVSVVIAGDYVAVHPGIYDTYTDVNRNVAVQASRIAIHGFGARIGAMQLRYSDWTVWGFEMNGTNGVGGGALYLNAAGPDRIYIRNITFRDTVAADNGGVIFAAQTGVDQTPITGANDCTVIGCYWTNAYTILVNIGRGSNWLVSNFIAEDGEGQPDFARPRGQNHTFQDGYIYNLNPGDTAGHVDILQLDNQTVVEGWFKDILFQRVLMEGNTNSAVADMAIAQIESGHYADSRWTNCVFRSCVFKYVRGAASDSNDGLKFLNCTFIGTPREFGSITTGGGERGSSYGTTFHNNIFLGGGPIESDDTGWYYRANSGDQATNTTVIGDYNFVAGFSGASKDPLEWNYNGQEANSINGGDPEFVGLSIADYRLKTNSSPYLAGLNLTAQFLGDDVDFLGNPYPASGAWSMGAFNVAADSTGTEPPPTDTTPPTPDPLTWASVPLTDDADSITMTASTATDAESPPVEYFFDETTGNPGGSDSGWQSSATYTDTGLTGSTLYTYRVSARDALGNQTGWSTSESDTTDADPEPDGLIINVGNLNVGTAQDPP